MQENVRVRKVIIYGGGDDTQTRLLTASLHFRLYLHDRNAEVGVDEGCGATCLDRGELWKRTFLQSSVTVSPPRAEFRSNSKRPQKLLLSLSKPTKTLETAIVIRTYLFKQKGDWIKTLWI